MRQLFTINNKPKELDVEPKETLLNVLRNNGYTEVHKGCERGECGACTVLIDGKPIPSCQVLAMSVIDTSIITVKGVGDIRNAHIIQKAFAQRGGSQCGYCTPGMILSTYALLQKNPNPTEEDIKTALDGNLCRCTGYVKIIDSVKYAAEHIRMVREKTS